MKTLSFFIAGIGSVLTFGWPSGMKYPFQFPAKAIGKDWENVGRDLQKAINNLERKQ